MGCPGETRGWECNKSFGWPSSWWGLGQIARGQFAHSSFDNSTVLSRIFIHISFRSIRSHFHQKFWKLLHIDSFPSRFHTFRFAKLLYILLSCPKFNALRHYNAGDNKHRHVRRHNIRRISKGMKLPIVDCHVLFARTSKRTSLYRKPIIEQG